jgi:hypothetical protein
MHIALFFSSFLVMAMMTLAFSLRNIWSHPQLLEQAGVARPRCFLVQYAISYVAAKLGILLLMASGDAPEWFGCGGCDALPADSEYSDALPADSEYSDALPADSGSWERIPGQWRIGTKEYCIQFPNAKTDCKSRFFKQAAEPDLGTVSYHCSGAAPDAHDVIRVVCRSSARAWVDHLPRSRGAVGLLDSGLYYKG